MNDYHSNYYSRYHHAQRQPQSGPTTPPYQLWSPEEASQNIGAYRGQYIRTSITGYGLVYAQLTDYHPHTGTVDLNVYFTPGRPPSFMRVNRNDLTGIVPLGFQPPPEILAPPAPTPAPSSRPPWCQWAPWHPMCQ
ncbi:hypothetical protein [Bacillus thermotolerans]|uniref:Uncharacterized protein n=1 Tax=Bacillus thermotolerans TaxID=1221996 RepID=A0A0F5HSM7_BACTR|nr:hypothetical protein [Bacillus thermotolerans]KKB36263.1 hypothetical protein QY95_03127 [Bacillus thermotolerans]